MYEIFNQNIFLSSGFWIGQAEVANKQFLFVWDLEFRIIWFSSGRYHITSPWPRGLRARLGTERSGVQIPVKAIHFFFQIV
jgi:hypothetical protein